MQMATFLDGVPPPAQPRFWLTQGARRASEQAAGGGDGVKTLPAQGREEGPGA